MGLAASHVDAAAGLQLSGVTLRQGRATVLDDLTVSLSKARVTAVIGGSARGRTTLFDVLAGFERASGKITLDGRDITRTPAHLRGFGVVRHADALFPHLTLTQNVAFPLRVRGLPSGQRRDLAADMMEMVQISPATGQFLPAQASRAERQRALLARAAVVVPPVLLLGDPVADQDAASKGVLLKALRNLHALSGATTLVFASDTADALAVADDLVVLRNGAVVQHGSAQDVFDHPRDADIAALMGDTNIFPGSIENIDDDVASIRLACGPVVEARPDMTLRPGDACVLMLRPDRIALVAIPAAEMGEAAIAATVIGVQFVGEVYRLRLLVGSGAELVVRRPVAAGLRGMVAGSAISVAWQPHHAWASPASRLDGRRPMADS